MSSVTDPQPDPAADEIVAYLDGELPPQDCRRVESRLATDDGYRQQLHELDRAWEALDVLPAPTVDDNFARTTIELACVAAEADLTEHTATAKAAKRSRAWRWIAGGIAAGVFGFLAGLALIPHRNQALLVDLPAIQQQNILPYVEDVEFLRLLSAAVPLEQLKRDEPLFEHNLQELESANSPSFDTRREWIQSLQPERKAELADRTRAFDDLEPASEERERMRNVMTDIRSAKDSETLQKTLVAYGQWLSRHTAGQQEQLLEQLDGLSADKRVAVVQKHLEREGEQLFRHLTQEDAEKLRQEIIQIAKERQSEFGRMRQGRKAERPLGFEEQRTRQTLAELFQEKDNNKRLETEKRLVSTLSPVAQAHWESLGRGQREFGKQRQLWVWIQDAMKLKASPEDLVKFFADEDKLTPDQRQKLLDEPRAKMESDLERLYIRSELGIENASQVFGDFGEPGRMPWTGPGGMGPPREPRPDGGPGERRPPRPRRPPGDRPPPKDQKQEAI